MSPGWLICISRPHRLIDALTDSVSFQLLISVSVCPNILSTLFPLFLLSIYLVEIAMVIWRCCKPNTREKSISVVHQWILVLRKKVVRNAWVVIIVLYNWLLFINGAKLRILVFVKVFVSDRAFFEGFFSNCSNLAASRFVPAARYVPRSEQEKQMLVLTLKKTNVWSAQSWLYDCRSLRTANPTDREATAIPLQSSTNSCEKYVTDLKILVASMAAKNLSWAMQKACLCPMSFIKSLSRFQVGGVAQ